ncbi:MAG: glycosyl hydrolase [Chloroflexota bacterium]|nr:glycosyl hydrolase [Chloroflexota bacterium]
MALSHHQNGKAGTNGTGNESTNPLQKLEWRCVGPHRGGRVVAVAGDPSNLGTFYFGSTGGGVWKTTDGGQYWENVSDGFFQRASVGGLALCPADPNVLYAAMGEATIRGNVSHGDGVYRSTDAGRTWKHLGLERTRNIGKVRVHPQNPDLVYVAALGHAHGPNPERGLYRSSDGGKHWSLVLSRGENAGAVDLVLDPANPRILYASFWEARRGPYELSSGGPGSGLWRSTDGGDTWTDLSNKPGMPKGIKGKIGLAASAQSGRVWAIVEHDQGGVFRSDDGGETWERLNEERNLRQRAWYYSHLCADPQDPNTVWCLNVEMHRSVDGGKTFQVVPAPHGDNHDLWIDPANPQRMILGNDGGGTVSFNGGLSWSTFYNQPTAELYHVTVDAQTPYRLYGAQQDNTTMSVPGRSNRDAITVTEWYEIGGGESGHIAVHPDKPNVVYAGSYQGFLSRYDHATGQLRDVSVWPEEYSGWAAQDFKHRFNWTSPTLISPHDPNTLYTAANVVFRSTNEGESWEAISPDLSRNDPATLGPSGGPITKDNTGAEVYGTVFALAESPVQPGLLWAGSDDGLVHLSRDGGASWQHVTPPELPEWALISAVEPSPHDPAVAYLAATRYKRDDFQPYLFKTEDFGQSWRKITDGIPEDDFTRVLREDPTRPGLLYAGTETGIYVSFDGGEGWRRLGGNLPVVPIHDLVLAQGDLVVATHGRSFWILDDVSLLHQLAAHDGEAASETRLFHPRDTTRFGRLSGFGHSPVPGKNFAFAAGLIPAFNQTTDPDGETKTAWLDAGTNPPNGVVVHYALADEPKEPITLAVLDAEGQEIRSFKSKERKDEETAVGSNGTGNGLATAEPAAPIGAVAGGEDVASDQDEDEKDKEPTVPAKPGLNRFVWNGRHADAAKIATKGGDQPGRDGPLLPPGDYRVRLVVGDREFSESFRILKDPRVVAGEADLAAQFALGLEIRDTLTAVNEAINRIRAVREQADLWAKRTAETPQQEPIAAAAKALKTKLDGIEGELIQTKAKSSQDTLNFPVRLNSKLAALGGSVGAGDTAPTAQQRALFADLSARVDAQLTALRGVEETDIPAFNALVRDAALPAIPPPVAPAPAPAAAD